MPSMLLTIETEVEVFYHHGQRLAGEDEAMLYPDEAHVQTVCPREVADWLAGQAVWQFNEKVKKGEICS